MNRKIKLTKTSQLRLDQLLVFRRRMVRKSQTGFHRKTR